jgi:hypothetical protein
LGSFLGPLAVTLGGAGGVTVNIRGMQEVGLLYLVPVGDSRIWR